MIINQYFLRSDLFGMPSIGEMIADPRLFRDGKKEIAGFLIQLSKLNPRREH